MKKDMTRRDFLARCGRCALYCACVDAFALPAVSAAASGVTLEKGLLGRKLSPYFTPLGDRRVRCELCPKGCEVASGDRGDCRVRENVDGRYYSLAYGNPCAVHVDPVEKKPFFHVLPSSLSFSIATAGCNFDCKFCQNWEISQAKPEDTLNYDLPPSLVIEHALRNCCRSIASTYVEPTIFAEYMIDIGVLARENGLLNVMHSNGYINDAPLRDLCRVLDAACIDLKGFSEDYYREITGGTLAPVLSTLKRLRERGVHTEIVNLVVTGKNDDAAGVRSMCRWILKELGPDVPIHFTRFYPLYKLKSLEPTPLSALETARDAALREGLHYVYIGNVPGNEAEHTFCPKCKARVIERVGYRVDASRLKEGRCAACGQTIPGIWEIVPAGAKPKA